MNGKIIILSATLLSLSYGAFISPRPETELYLIRLRIELLTRQLHDACPHLVNHGLFLGKRSADQHQQTMEMEREIHNHILHLLNRCFQEQVTNKPSTTTTQTTSTETTSTHTTSTQQTSTETTSTETTSAETTSTETTSTPSTTTQTTTTQKTSTHTTSPPTTSTQMTSTPFWCWGWTVNYRVPTKPSTTTTQTTSTETTPPLVCSTEATSTETTSTETTSTEKTPTEKTSTEKTSETTSTETTSTPSTTTQMTSTPFWWWTTNYMVQLPWQCTSSSTRNLTESWRNNSPPVHPLNDDTGVLDRGRTWFRFTGRAGNLLKSTCPDVYSCGSDGAFWSDSNLPYCPGETRSITLYESYWQVGEARGRCSVRSFRGKATRCSMDRGGVVYRMDDAFSGGRNTICGMY